MPVARMCVFSTTCSNLLCRHKFYKYARESDMRDIQANWVDEPGRAFWVAQEGVGGGLVGATALRMGDVLPEKNDRPGSLSFKPLEPDTAELLRMTVSACWTHSAGACVYT